MVKIIENPIKMDDLGSFQSLEVLLRKAGAETETEMIEVRTDFMGLSAVKVGRVNRGPHRGQGKPSKNSGLMKTQLVSFSKAGYEIEPFISQKGMLEAVGWQGIIGACGCLGWRTSTMNSELFSWWCFKDWTMVNHHFSPPICDVFFFLSAC